MKECGYYQKTLRARGWRPVLDDTGLYTVRTLDGEGFCRKPFLFPATALQPCSPQWAWSSAFGYFNSAWALRASFAASACSSLRTSLISNMRRVVLKEPYWCVPDSQQPKSKLSPSPQLRRLAPVFVPAPFTATGCAFHFSKTPYFTQRFPQIAAECAVWMASRAKSSTRSVSARTC